MINPTDADQLAKVELQRLEQQLRLLKKQIHGLLAYKNKELRKQNRLISLFQKEHQQLNGEIHILENGTHARRTACRERFFNNLQQQQYEIQYEVQQEQKKLMEFEDHIRKLEREVNGIRKWEIADTCYKSSIDEIQRRVIKLENRLDVVNKKRSDVLSNFNQIWQSMIHQINDGKKIIMDLIDQSTMAYDQRADLCSKLQILKERNENDEITHIQEMRELQRRLEHDAKLQEFFDIKCQKRSNQELQQRELTKSVAKKEAFEKQINAYQDIIEKIQELYEITDMECLIIRYKQEQDENFALFSYVSELGYEVEVLNESIKSLEDEIERQQAELLEKEQIQKTESLDYLNDELRQAELENTINKEKADNLEKQLDELLQGIDEIFRQLSCNDAPILNILSSQTTLNINNVKLFSGVIERRLNLIVGQLAATADDDNLTANRLLAKKNRIPKFNIKRTKKLK